MSRRRASLVLIIIKPLCRHGLVLILFILQHGNWPIYQPNVGLARAKISCLSWKLPVVGKSQVSANWANAADDANYVDVLPIISSSPLIEDKLSTPHCYHSQRLWVDIGASGLNIPADWLISESYKALNIGYYLYVYNINKRLSVSNSPSRTYLSVSWDIWEPVTWHPQH